LKLDHLEEFNLNYNYRSPHNDTYTAIPVSTGEDALSVALHHFTQAPNLKYITIGCQLCPISISSAIFWPNDTAIPCWPNLLGFFIGFSMVAPNGRWYNKRPPRRPRSQYTDSVDSAEEEESEEDDEETYLAHDMQQLSDDPLALLADATCDALHEESIPDYDEYDSEETNILIRNAPHHVRRKTLIPERINPLLIAMAKASKYMPKIKYLNLEGRTRGSPFEVGYVAENDKVIWKIPQGTSFEIDDEIISAWRNSTGMSRENATCYS